MLGCKERQGWKFMGLGADTLRHRAQLTRQTGREGLRGRVGGSEGQGAPLGVQGGTGAAPKGRQGGAPCWFSLAKGLYTSANDA